LWALVNTKKEEVNKAGNQGATILKLEEHALV
jgi:hypothetical protein